MHTVLGLADTSEAEQCPVVATFDFDWKGSLPKQVIT
jgi:hypothetical protein